MIRPAVGVKAPPQAIRFENCAVTARAAHFYPTIMDDGFKQVGRKHHIPNAAHITPPGLKPELAPI